MNWDDMLSWDESQSYLASAFLIATQLDQGYTPIMICLHDGCASTSIMSREHERDCTGCRRLRSRGSMCLDLLQDIREQVTPINQVWWSLEDTVLYCTILSIDSALRSAIFSTCAHHLCASVSLPRRKSFRATLLLNSNI
jgi:hypothetical protein